MPPKRPFRLLLKIVLEKQTFLELPTETSLRLHLEFTLKVHNFVELIVKCPLPSFKNAPLFPPAYMQNLIKIAINMSPNELKVRTKELRLEMIRLPLELPLELLIKLQKDFKLDLAFNSLLTNKIAYSFNLPNILLEKQLDSQLETLEKSFLSGYDILTPFQPTFMQNFIKITFLKNLQHYSKMHENHATMILCRMQKVKVKNVRKKIHDSAPVLRSRTLAKIQKLHLKDSNHGPVCRDL